MTEWVRLEGKDEQLHLKDPLNDSFQTLVLHWNELEPAFKNPDSWSATEAT